MTPTEVKQAADEMVERFEPYSNSGSCITRGAMDRAKRYSATRISIAHCKLVIEEFGENVWMVDAETTNIQKYRLILSELEGRVK